MICPRLGRGRDKLTRLRKYLSAYLVRNIHRGHLYFVIFAGPNRTGVKIANTILTSRIEDSYSVF